MTLPFDLRGGEPLGGRNVGGGNGVSLTANAPTATLSTGPGQGYFSANIQTLPCAATMSDGEVLTALETTVP